MTTGMQVVIECGTCGNLTKGAILPRVIQGDLFEDLGFVVSGLLDKNLYASPALSAFVLDPNTGTYIAGGADGANLYFATWSTIYRSGKDGANLYWTDKYQGTVSRKALTGGSVVTMVTEENHPDDLMLDAGTLYFSTDDGIKTVPAAGGPVTPFSTARGYMTKEGSSLYVVNDSCLARVNRTDGSVTVLVTGIQSWSRPAVTDTHVYWLDAGSQYGGRYGSLSRVAR